MESPGEHHNVLHVLSNYLGLSVFLMVVFYVSSQKTLFDHFA